MIDKKSWVYDLECPKSMAKVERKWIANMLKTDSIFHIKKEYVPYVLTAWKDLSTTLLIPYDASLEGEYEAERKEAYKLC